MSLPALSLILSNSLICKKILCWISLVHHPSYYAVINFQPPLPRPPLLFLINCPWLSLFAPRHLIAKTSKNDHKYPSVWSQLLFSAQFHKITWTEAILLNYFFIFPNWFSSSPFKPLLHLTFTKKQDLVNISVVRPPISQKEICLRVRWSKNGVWLWERDAICHALWGSTWRRCSLLLELPCLLVMLL